MSVSTKLMTLICSSISLISSFSISLIPALFSCELKCCSGEDLVNVTCAELSVSPTTLHNRLVMFNVISCYAQ